MSSADASTLQIFNFIANDFMEIEYYPDIKCEEVCIQCCKKLNILPTARLLFGLRVFDTEKWLFLCAVPKIKEKYEFRMRFKVPELDSLYKIDPNAYEYLYAQKRYELVNDRISDIRYPAYKDNVIGLGAVDMYIDYNSKQLTVETLEKNYKSYLPKPLVKTHKIFAKKNICEGFGRIRRGNHELSRAKRIYMHQITELSPNYLMESYNAKTSDLAEQDVAPGPITVIIKLDPFDPEGPVLKAFLKLKKEWIVVTKLENIYALYRKDKRFVHLEVSDAPKGYQFEFERPRDVKSFMSYVSGYFRLMYKWMADPCLQFVTPSMLELKELRCHGPVGGDFSYAKIREKEGKCGSYIVRQCEREYDVYYIDINTKSTQTETFKITRIGNAWQLHINDSTQCFVKLTELALGIPTSSEKFRIPPSEYDKPPLLLICLPRNLQLKKTDNELSEAQLLRKRVQIFDPKEDLQWYKNSQRLCDNGRMEWLRADWIQPRNVRDVPVTLKVLKSEQDFPEFMKLANTWSRIYAPEFLKLYGLTLSTPYTMVMEHSSFGSLNEFLYNSKEKVSFECLLNAVHGLVRGIAYLQEKGLIHGYIRCNYLMVTKFDPKKNFMIVKISDPGLPRSYKLQDLPWIPFEHHKNLNAAKRDIYAELWAFATTMWEIFSRGKSIATLSPETLTQNYNRYGGILPKPNECPEDLYQIIMDGWSMDPDKRFNQQVILRLLNSAKENLSRNYSTIDTTDTFSDDMSSICSDLSHMTEETCQTLLNGNSSGDVHSCNISLNSTIGERVPLLRRNVHDPIGSHHSNYFDETPSVVSISNGKIIYKEQIGEGHYGMVHRGEIQYNDNSGPIQVAIKTLKCNRFSQDFKREIKIMQALDHPNIVKIIMSVEAPYVSIIMEYVECGSFIVYLSSMKPNLTNAKLLNFALDIAKGMEYLRSKKVIHRDLAARNILVDGDRVKISDFGLAQLANTDGYYFAQSEREIPIKWYAPESIKTTKFSFQSDVWSYGVTLFEMFSRGEKPNLDPDHDLSQTNFLDRLESGDRLRKPELCPVNIYEKLMMPCWHEDPKLRPDFKKIIEIIQTIKNESGERI